MNVLTRILARVPNASIDPAIWDHVPLTFFTKTGFYVHAALAALEPSGREKLQKKGRSMKNHYGSGVTVSTAVEKFINEKIVAGVASATVAVYQHVLQVLIALFGDLPLATLSEASFQQALAIAQTMAAKRTHYNVFSTFAAWAAASGAMPGNPVKLPPNLRVVPSARVSPYTVNEVQQILSSLQDPADLAVVALAAFAGLRPGEIARLKCQDIRDDRIVVHGQVKHVSRYVAITPTLQAWLAAFQGAQGFDLPSPNEVLRRAQAAGVKVKFVTLRVTCITYSLAMTRNIEAVAQQAGINVPVFQRHHITPVSQKVAEKFFALTPEACGHSAWAKKVQEYLAALAKRRDMSSGSGSTTPPLN